MLPQDHCLLNLMTHLLRKRSGINSSQQLLSLFLLFRKRYWNETSSANNIIRARPNKRSLDLCLQWIKCISILCRRSEMDYRTLILFMCTKKHYLIQQIRKCTYLRTKHFSWLSLTIAIRTFNSTIITRKVNNTNRNTETLLVNNSRSNASISPSKILYVHR